jgi:hypothetical protein
MRGTCAEISQFCRFTEIPSRASTAPAWCPVREAMRVESGEQKLAGRFSAAAGELPDGGLGALALSRHAL